MQHILRPHPHRTRVRKFERKSFDVACVQCEHSHSRTQVSFALRRVARARPVWTRPNVQAKTRILRKEIRRIANSANTLSLDLGRILGIFLAAEELQISRCELHQLQCEQHWVLRVKITLEMVRCTVDIASALKPQTRTENFAQANGLQKSGTSCFLQRISTAGLTIICAHLFSCVNCSNISVDPIGSTINAISFFGVNSTHPDCEV